MHSKLVIMLTIYFTVIREQEKLEKIHFCCASKLYDATIPSVVEA